MDIDKLEYRNLQGLNEAEAAWPIEKDGYPEDEAASFDNIRYRFTSAPHLFYGAFAGDELVGYIMSTQAASPLVTHESMSLHDPQGTTVCVHSVCVSAKWQRKGLATQLLKKYTEAMRLYNKTASVK
ncbi:hypothetical protein IWW36_002118 [Coemansia brasiliensis]|uniref:N-acetyltransferase domain-containing protein n=1 Tax=Coemansia brasiliensis TaxID=2650707 RepID=A0A9W8IFG9_9FUNG|nr:hypothetical protein IWW36_002118 [Coemansia brasiliensis]